MNKKEAQPGRSINRIDLSLPAVQTDSYEIFYNLPPSQNVRTITRQKPLIETTKKSVNQSTRIRSPARLRHLIGPVYVNVLVDTSAMAADSNSSMTETMSNPILNSIFPHRRLKPLPTLIKRPNKLRTTKDDGDRSCSSSGDRLVYESLGSFDDQNIHKFKTNNMWQNIHHPQLTSTKTIHLRRIPKNSLASNDASNKLSNTAFPDNLSQESITSVNEQLYERIEQLTKNYFPVIQQIRHSRPSPETINNRMHLHREHQGGFMPVLSRTRIVQ